mgnify:CR=1 FL=1
MTLFDALRSECVQIGSQARTKDEVLWEVADLARQAPPLAGRDRSELHQLLKDREEQGSTGFGGGIAIPHASIDDVDEFVVGVQIAAEGVPFESLDGDPATIVVFIFGPSNRRNEHIRLLSSVSAILSNERAVAEVFAAKTPEAVREAILRHEEPVAEEEDQKRSMVFAFVQDENRFERILQIFSASVNGSVSVIEASNARAFLNRLPVFSGFWTETSAGFQRVIVGIVESKFSNDVVRRIHTEANREEAEGGLLVAVLELAYCSGNLDF